MKNKIFVLLVATLCLGLLACGNEIEQKSDEVIVQDENSQVGDGVNIVNPWTTSDQQGVLDATGFDMEAPEGATNINYSYMEDGKLAELAYDYDDVAWVYRIQPTESLTDISGMNYEWISDTSGKVLEYDAKYLGYSEQAEDSESLDDLFYVQVVNWYDDINKVTYSLSASGKNLDGMDIQVYAENLYKQGQAGDDKNN